MHTLRVTMISSSFPTNREDWRSVFIRQMAESVGRRDDIRLNIWAPNGEANPDIRFVTSAKTRAHLETLMHSGGLAHILRNRPTRAFRAAFDFLRHMRRDLANSPASDVYHVNWLQNVLGLPPDRKPAVVTVLGSDLPLLRLPFMKSILRACFRNRAAVLAPNAEWMRADLTRAFGDLVAGVEYVPLGIDSTWFDIRSRPATDRPANWLCVTRLTRQKLGNLFELCEPIFEQGRRNLHLFGPNQDNVAVPPWVSYHGPASPECLLSDWFPNAHGVITMSTHDEGRPQFLLESLAAGLPVLASDIPGHAFVRATGAGFLCTQISEVQRAIEAVENPAHDRNRLSEIGRRWARENIGTWDDAARRYVNIYRHLLRQKT